jgi:peptidoglycan/xylan/chitin deacetylase (PgdA/CDA1 family)
VAITIDDGPDPEVTPAVLDQLAPHGAHATFFCIAERARRSRRSCAHRGRRPQRAEPQPAAPAPLLAAGAAAGFAREIVGCPGGAGRPERRAPHCFFRAPAGLRNPLLDPVLHRLGLHLVSWTRRGFDTREARPARE